MSTLPLRDTFAIGFWVVRFFNWILKAFMCPGFYERRGLVITCIRNKVLCCTCLNLSDAGHRTEKSLCHDALKEESQILHRLSVIPFNFQTWINVLRKIFVLSGRSFNILFYNTICPLPYLCILLLPKQYWQKQKSFSFEKSLLGGVFLLPLKFNLAGTLIFFHFEYSVTNEHGSLPATLNRVYF